MKAFIKLSPPFLFLIFLSSFWNVSGWIYSRGPITLDCIALFFMAFAIYNYTPVDKMCNGSPYLKLVKYLWLAPFLTVFVKMVYTGESLKSEVQTTLIMCMTFSIFYYLFKNKITERQCLYLLFFWGLLTFFLQVYQLTHLDNRIFGFNEEGGSGTRNNLARLAIGAPLFSVFLFYLFWTCLIKSHGITRIFALAGSIVFLASLYLYLTRQYLIAVAATIILSIFLQKNSHLKFIVLFVCCLMAYILYGYYDVLFGDLIYITKNDTYSTDIRQVSYIFFFNEIFSDPIRALVGHGHIHETLKLGESKGLWAVDIGIIGDMYHYGFLWGIAYFWMVYYTWKNRKILPMYLKLYVFSTLIHSPMASAYVYGLTAFLWTIVIYVSQLRISKSPLVDKTQLI